MNAWTDISLPVFAPPRFIPHELSAPMQMWQEILADHKRLAGLLRKRRLIGYGAFGVVYRVGDAAIKIGCIGENEPTIQQWVHEHHQRALPVWAFCPDVDLPTTVRREVCPHHGFPSNLWTASSVNCHCEEPMPVLVMPLAERADQRAVDGEDFSESVFDTVVEKFGVCLDIHKGNFLEFNGRLILCDFGDTNDPLADYW
jgi:hypothetical protein